MILIILGGILGFIIFSLFCMIEVSSKFDDED